MSAPGGGPGPEEEFARPFLTSHFDAASGDLGAAPATPSHVPAVDESDDVEDDSFVRAYIVTGGRVHDGLGDFSTVYALTGSGRAALGTLAFESRQIAQLCEEAQSVAEISAHLRLPLGVVTVLARDLFDAGLLAAAASAPDPAADVSLITRLIHAVHAL